MNEMVESKATQTFGVYPDRRSQLRVHVEAGHRDHAIQAARQLLAEQPGVRSWRFMRKLMAEARPGALALKPLKIALLSSFSIEFMHDALIAYGFVSGFEIEVYQAGFGAFRQEL